MSDSGSDDLGSNPGRVTKIKKPVRYRTGFFILVTLPGFEPRSSEPESDILSIEL